MPIPPKLPKLLDRKFYKTGQTRGADDDVIFQNRVSRNSTVLINYSNIDLASTAPDNDGKFENGFIVLIRPDEFFDNPESEQTMLVKGLVLGENSLLFYETREHWNKYNPEQKGLAFATSRTNPLGGQYVARVPSNTSEYAEKILRGYTNTSLKGAGIRVYEYASQEIIKSCRVQLEFLFWHCENSKAVAKFMGMSEEDIEEHLRLNSECAEELGLNDLVQLKEARILNDDESTICPLCLNPLSANGFFNRLEQAAGRDVPDLTVTELNLFHIKELRIGEFNHKPYNLGWGHHHCNVVTKDSGIMETLKWMAEVVDRNESKGYEIR